MDAFDSAGVTGIIRRRVKAGCEVRAEELMRGILRLAREAEGFLGSEIFPPIPGVQDAYVVLYRFDSGSHLRAWLASPERQALIAEIEGLVSEPSVEFFFSHGRRQAGTASSVFAYRVRQEKRGEFQEWRRRILAAAKTFEGFLGTESFDTLEGGEPEFIVVVRFDSRPHLDAWLGSDVRAKFMDEVAEFIHAVRLRRIGSGFEGWFDISSESRPPARWRQAMVILSALFPVILSIRAFMAPIFQVLPMPVAFLILLTVDMAFLTYVVMPRYSRLMRFWLNPPPRADWRREVCGWVILLGVIGVTLGVALAVG